MIHAFRRKFYPNDTASDPVNRNRPSARESESSDVKFRGPSGTVGVPIRTPIHLSRTERFPQNARVVANPFAPTLFTQKRPESCGGLRALTRGLAWVCRRKFNSPKRTRTLNPSVNAISTSEGCQVAAIFSGILLCSYCPVKRSSALRGRNRTRNNRTDGAPRRKQPLCRTPCLGLLIFLSDHRFGHRSDAPENPGVPGAAPLAAVLRSTVCVALSWNR
jgi:hypothetical protein